jgi:hypothetical protein
MPRPGKSLFPRSPPQHRMSDREQRGFPCPAPKALALRLPWHGRLVHGRPSSLAVVRPSVPQSAARVPQSVSRYPLRIRFGSGRYPLLLRKVSTFWQLHGPPSSRKHRKNLVLHRISSESPAAPPLSFRPSPTHPLISPFLPRCSTNEPNEPIKYRSVASRTAFLTHEAQSPIAKRTHSPFRQQFRRRFHAARSCNTRPPLVALSHVACPRHLQHPLICTFHSIRVHFALTSSIEPSSRRAVEPSSRHRGRSTPTEEP